MQPNLKNIRYSGGDVTAMPKIARISTKPIRVRYGLKAESSTFDVVEISKDASGKKVYVCDFWHSPGEPYFVSEAQVLKVFNFI